MNRRASRVQWSLMLLAITVFMPGCAEREFQTASLTSSSPALSKQPSDCIQTYRETGTASWYGKDFHGKKTASGEIFDMYALSAAHRTLPLGTVLRVTNLVNFMSIEVRVNDRGPFNKNWIISLSYQAARKLAFGAEGITPIKIEAVGPCSENGLYTVQAAVFTEEENAKLLKDRLSAKFGLISIIPVESVQGMFYRVMIGSYRSEEKAELVASRLKLEGVEPVVMMKD